MTTPPQLSGYLNQSSNYHFPLFMYLLFTLVIQYHNRHLILNMLIFCVKVNSTDNELVNV